MCFAAAIKRRSDRVQAVAALALRAPAATRHTALVELSDTAHKIRDASDRARALAALLPLAAAEGQDDSAWEPLNAQIGTLALALGRAIARAEREAH
jgi:hypothetical protein